MQLAGQLAAPYSRERGQNITTLEAARQRQAIAMNDFEKSVLSASAEVSDAFSKYSNNHQKREFLLKQIDCLEKVWNIRRNY